MIAAVESLGRRLDDFVERERLFTRDASHELRTPIAVFKGSLDLLERKNSLSEADAKILQRMRRSVEGMETLVETLLMLAREDGFGEQPDSFDAAALVQKQVDALQPLAENTNNVLTVHCDSAIISSTHPRVIEILTSNLISNALQFTSNGQVSVSINNKQLAVADTGIGMDEDTQARMFQPFFRGNPEVNGGYGLGLAIVRRLVDRCGWQLQVSSARNEGTTITILFSSQ